MSVESKLYLGYYFDIKPVKQMVGRTYDGCNICKKASNAKFCSDCGASIGRINVEIETETSIYTLLENMGKQWDYFIRNTDHYCNTPSTIYVLTHRGNIDTDDRKVVKFTDGKIPAPDDRTIEFLNAFKSKYGEDSIKMEYGLVYYFT